MNLGKGLNSSHFKRVISFFEVSKFTLNLDTLARFLYFLIFYSFKSLNLCIWVFLGYRLVIFVSLNLYLGAFSLSFEVYIFKFMF